MTEDELVGLLKQHLVTAAAGFLRNPLKPAAMTCDLCSGPISAQYTRCYKCDFVYRGDARCSEHVASMTYAIQGQQGGYMMHGYKAKLSPVREHVALVGSLAWVGLSHRHCIGKITTEPVSAWATVPSLPAKEEQHPLHRLISQHPTLQLADIPLAAAAQAVDARNFVPENFTVEVSPNGAHVLLIDDTWASGGHAQSAAAALTIAGAHRVSILTIARWPNPAWDVTRTFIKDHWNDRRYNPDLCPWTVNIQPSVGVGA